MLIISEVQYVWTKAQSMQDKLCFNFTIVWWDFAIYLLLLP